MFDDMVYTMYKDPPHFSWDMLLSGDETPIKIRDTIQGENALAHTHDFIEIVMVHHGKGTHICFPPDGKAVSNTIIKGDVFVILPGEKHAYANCRRFICGYCLNFCKKINRDSSVDKSQLV